jgi:hypothetical protein
MDAMQGQRKQPEPVVREKSFQQLERDRIGREYEKLHTLEVVIDDPDDPRYYMDVDEIREFEKKKLAAEQGKTQQDRRAEVIKHIYAKDAPQPEPEEEANPFDDRPAVQAAYEDFRARHPDITDADWKAMNDERFILSAPDVPELRKKMNASGSRADMDRVLERAADAYATAKVNRERSRYVEWLQRRRDPVGDAGLAKMNQFMKGAK